MNDLKELIGQTVKAEIHKDENGIGTMITCKIIDLHIRDEFYQTKDECIYITVNVEPIGDYTFPNDFDYEELSGISLYDIRKI